MSEHPSHADLERSIGRLEGRMDAMGASLKKVQQDMEDVKDTLSQARGSWKTLVAVATISGAAGAALAKIVPWFWGLPK